MKVGIDFGTTTSTICRVSRDGHIDVQGHIPSIAAWKNGEWFFAKQAEELLSSDDRSAFPVRDLKLSLGTKSIKIGPHVVDTGEAVSSLLRFLAKRIAGNETIESAVIGTPVNVSVGHRSALIRAAESAGFKDVKLVYEPTSALVGAVDPAKLDSRALVLVVDWGGGTLDLALVRKEGDLVREIAVDGDVLDLGGSRMDEEILKLVLARSPSLREKLEVIDGGFDRLKYELEGIKREILSDGFVDPADEPRRLVSHWLGDRIEVHPADVLQVVRKMAALGKDRIAKFLSSAGISPPDVTHILFAGGVSNSPIVQEEVQSHFRNSKIISAAQNPQLLTAYGCAELLNRGFTLQLAAAFGVRQVDDSFCEMLPAGHDLAVDAYRVAEFMVTDVLAPEAIFDLGISRPLNGETAMISNGGHAFRSMGQLFLRAQDRPGENKGNGTDLVRLFCGIDSTLAVKTFAESHLTGHARQIAISGLPLCIKVGG